MMKAFKKLFLVCLFLVVMLALVGCGDTPDPNNGGNNGDPNNGNSNNNNNNNNQHEWTENELFWDSDKNGIPDWQEEEITLRYATWQYNNSEVETIDTYLIKEFMKKYPNITVEMQIVGESTEWEMKFLELLENPDDIPDVFLVNRLENILSYGILADITDYFDHDDDTQYIFDSVRDLGLYKGRRYVVPTFIYPEIWLVNKTLLEDCNIPTPDYDWTWDQMEAIAKAVYGARGTEHAIGLYGTDEYYFELPKIMKEAISYEDGAKWYGYGYDGEKFNFSDDAYLQAMAKMEKGMDEEWLVNQLDEEKLMEYYGNTIDPRYSGQVAIWRQPSWEFKDHAADLQFEWDVYPGPSGVTGGNTDIAGVYSLCKHKAAAYQLLKWMSFGQDGMITRYDLYDKYQDELYVSADNYPYPVVDYGINGDGENLIWDNIPYTEKAPGYGAAEFVESLRNGAIKANKEVIGWDAAENTFKDYLYEIIMNGQQYAALYPTIQEATDLALKQKRDAVDAMVGN